MFAIVAASAGLAGRIENAGCDPTAMSSTGIASPEAGDSAPAIASSTWELGRIGEADIDTEAVRREPLDVGEPADVGGQPGQAVARDRDQARALEEVMADKPDAHRAVPP